MGIGLRERAGGAVRPLSCVIACLTLLLAPAALSQVAEAAGPGALIWAKVIGGRETGYESLTAVAADAAGNGYFGGTVTTAGNGLDALVTRLSPSGGRVWTYTWDGVAHGDDGESMVAAVDGRAGRLFVAFATADAGGRQGLAVLCLTTGGKKLWARTWAAPRGFEAAWPVIAVDTRGNVAVATGAYEDTTEGWITREAHLLKYSHAGKLLWSRSWAPSGGGYAIAAIAAGPSGRLCVTGTTHSGAEARDIATVMYAAAGNQAWVKTWNNAEAGEGSEADYGFDVVGLPGGAVAVTGHTDGVGDAADRDAVVLKYTSAGALAWAKVRDEGGGQTESPLALAADAGGNVYAAGWAIGPDGSEDGYLLSYTTGGSYRWTGWFGDPSGYDQEIEGVAVAGTRLYFAARRYGSPADLQCVVGSVATATGARRWVGAFDGGTAYDETWPAAITVVPGKSVYVAAGAGAGDTFDGVALRFAP